MLLLSPLLFVSCLYFGMPMLRSHQSYNHMVLLWQSTLSAGTDNKTRSGIIKGPNSRVAVFREASLFRVSLH